MAELCAQCSKGMDDSEEWSELQLLAKKGYIGEVFCTSCGYIRVDSDGHCISPDCLVDHSTGKPRDYADLSVLNRELVL